MDNTIAIRLKCAELAINGCSKNGISRLEALDLAEKIYDFVIETPTKSSLNTKLVKGKTSKEAQK